MHEPHYSIFASAGIIGALLGPVFGPLVMLLFAAVMGGLLAMGRTSTHTRWEGVRFLAVGVGISLVLTGLAVWLVERYTTVPGNIAMMPVAFIIAASRNSLLGFIERALDDAKARVEAMADDGALVAFQDITAQRATIMTGLANMNTLLSGRAQGNSGWRI